MRAHIGKSRDLGKYVQDSDRAVHPISRNKGKEPIVPDDVDTPTDDELPLACSPSLSLSSAKNIRAKLCKRPSHRPAFSDTISGASRRERREVSMGKNQLDRVPRNALVLLAGPMPPMSLVHPTFGTRPTFYMPLVALIRGLDDMLSLPLGQHILDYKPPREFVIRAFATFDGSVDPYDHMLHYNQAMILNVDNDHLLCKVFPG